MSGFIRAVAFLTRIPTRTDHGPPGPAAAAWFPAVGTLIAILLAGIYAAAHGLMPSPLAALIAVTAGVVLTGGFHEDGLADTADALGSGEADALVVMRDPRLGTYGTLALVASFLGRVLALGSMGPAMAAAGLVMAHTLGRSASLLVMATTPGARPDGLAHSHVTGATSRGALLGGASGVVIAAVASGWWVIVAAATVSVSSLLVRGVASRRIGGVTGDVLGAVEQLGEISVLTLVAVGAWHGIEPWWAA